MSRHEFTKQTKRDAAERCKGNCECCGIKLRQGEFHYDHINPDWFSGSNDLDNCQVLCVKCHRRKTSEQDQPAISKTKRIIEKRQNITKPKRKIPGRRFNGEPIRYDTP